MTFVKLLLSSVALTSSLIAADAFTGTWKLNTAKSKYEAGEPTKEQTVTISDSGTDMMVKVEGISGTGRKVDYSFTVPQAGGTGKMMSAGGWDGVTMKVFGPTERQTDYLMGGKTILSLRSKVSTDGQTMTTVVKGSTTNGQKMSNTSVYDKQ
jgi:hypothetical protein